MTRFYHHLYQPLCTILLSQEWNTDVVLLCDIVKAQWVNDWTQQQQCVDEPAEGRDDLWEEQLIQESSTAEEASGLEGEDKIWQ